jgi:hypothetical protein
VRLKRFRVNEVNSGGLFLDGINHRLFVVAEPARYIFVLEYEQYGSCGSSGDGKAMKHIYDAGTLNEVKERVAQLRPDSERQWGTMNIAQAMAHCTKAIEMAEGRFHSPRMLLGRLVGPIAKRSLLYKGEPMRRGSMTEKHCVVADEREFAVEKERLLEAIDRFAKAGPAGCTKEPHFFFGKMKPEEWAALNYQHLDHHLRQFGG